MPTRGKQESVSVLMNSFAAAETKRRGCLGTSNTGAWFSPWIHGERLPVCGVPQMEQREVQGLPGASQAGDPTPAPQGVRSRARHVIGIQPSRLSVSDLRRSSQCPEPSGVRAEQRVAPAQAGTLETHREGALALSLGSAGHATEDAGHRGEQGLRRAAPEGPMQLLHRARRSHRAHPVGRRRGLVEPHGSLCVVQRQEAQPDTGRVPFVQAEAIVRSRGNDQPRSHCTDVYATLFLGRQALAKGYSNTDGNGPQPRVMLTPVTDHMRRFAGVAWYALEGFGRFREEALRRVETSSTIGTNA